MVELFVCTSEFVSFITSHPEYNHFEEVKNKYGELVGYDVSVVEENDKKTNN